MMEPTPQINIDEAMEHGLRQHRAGNLKEASAIYHQVLAGSPEHVEAIRMLGVIASQERRHDEAISLLKRAVQLKDQDVDISLDLAVALRAAGKMDEAAVVYERTLAHGQERAKILTAYGMFLKQRGQRDRAIEFLSEAAQLQPDSAPAQNVVGIALAEISRVAEAEHYFARCLEIDPNYVQAYNNLGSAYLQQRDLKNAETQFRKAISIDPDYAMGLENLGVTLMRQDRSAEAILPLQRAVELKPDQLKAYESLAWALIDQGDWSKGFEVLDSRCQIAGRRLPDGRRHWTGEDLESRTIFIYADGGAADVIQFARYLPLVSQRGGRVVFACGKPLVRLMAGVPSVARVIGPDDPLPAFDVQCALMSLPHRFQTTPQTVPSAKAAYLTVPLESLNRWKDRVGETAGKKVGLAWMGDASVIESLGEVPGVAFYQLKPSASPFAFPTLDLSAAVQEPVELAALLKNLGLVITDDSLIAQLAAALGRPTVLMIDPASIDPRWKRGQAESPWYGSLKLYWRAEGASWDSTVQRVKRSLEAWAKK